jgi:hypothetical protein
MYRKLSCFRDPGLVCSDCTGSLLVGDVRRAAASTLRSEAVKLKMPRPICTSCMPELDASWLRWRLSSGEDEVASVEPMTLHLSEDKELAVTCRCANNL